MPSTLRVRARLPPDMLLWLVILVRVVANPFSNVFQKVLTRRAADPLYVIGLTHGLLSVACLPALLLHHPPLAAGFWPNIALAAVLAVAGNALLVQAVRRSDLSVLGPINAYKSVVSLVPGMLLLGEFPRPVGLLGIGLIVAGSYFIVDKDEAGPRRNVFVRFLNDRGVQYRFAALFLSATEAVFLKRAVLASSPLATFAWWSVLGFAAALAGIGLLAPRRVRHEVGLLRANGRTYGLLTLTTGLMQLCTLYAFSGLQVGYALALFQTSALVSVYLGYKVFHERNIVERLIGSAVMVGGAVLIVLSR